MIICICNGVLKLNMLSLLLDFANLSQTYTVGTKKIRLISSGGIYQVVTTGTGCKAGTMYAIRKKRKKCF